MNNFLCSIGVLVFLVAVAVAVPALSAEDPPISSAAMPNINRPESHAGRIDVYSARFGRVRPVIAIVGEHGSPESSTEPCRAQVGKVYQAFWWAVAI